MARGEPGEETYQPRVPVEDLPRKLVPRMDGSQPGVEGLEQAVAATQQKYHADSATFAANQLNDFRTQTVQNLQKLKDSLPANQDPSGFVDQFQSQYDKGATALAASAKGNPIASQMLQSGLSNLRTSLTDHAIQWQAEQQHAYRTNSVLTNLDTQSAILRAHPELEAQIGSTFADQINSIGGDLKDRQQLGNHVTSQLSLATAEGFMRQDPRGMLQALNHPETAPDKFKPVISGLNDQQSEALRAKATEHMADGVYSALSAGDIKGANLALNQNRDLLDPRTQENLQRAINGQVEHNMVLHDKQLTDTSNSLLKQAMQMSLHPDGPNGPLTSQWIEKHYARFKPEAYEYANKLTTGKDVTNDPATVLPLWRDTLNGEDTTERWMKAVADGKVKMEEAVKGMEKASSVGGGPVQQETKYIDDKLTPSPFLAKFSNYKDKTADAMEEFHSYLRSTPNATPDDIRKASHLIVEAHSETAAASVLKDAPKYIIHWVGTPDAPDLVAMWEQTKAAHDAGQLSDDAFNWQTSLIVGVKHAVQLTNKKPVAPAKPQGSP